MFTTVVVLLQINNFEKQQVRRIIINGFTMAQSRHQISYIILVGTVVLKNFVADYHVHVQENFRILFTNSQLEVIKVGQNREI